DDPRKPLERVLRVRQPVAVVRVRHVVLARQGRLLARPEDAGDDRVRVGAPVARRARAVEDRQPDGCERRLPGRRVALLRLIVRDVRDRAEVRVHHSVLVTVWRDPSGWRAWTETGRGSMATGCPSRRYDVGSPGTSVSWYGVNRNAVETVWLHATVAVWPMLLAGTPYSPTPVT